MKIIDLVNPDFNVLLDKLQKESFPINSALKLQKILNTINVTYLDYELKREDLLKKYGDKNPDGSLILDDKGTVNFSEENMSKFIEEIEKISHKEVNIDKLYPEEFPRSIAFTQQELNLLMPLLDIK